MQRDIMHDSPGSHSPTYDISMEGLSKMEGHTDLDISVKDGVVVDLKLKVSESKRFFTQAIRGKSALAVPQLVSRICGTCSIPHLLACTQAVEYAMGVEPTAQTRKLRELSEVGNILRDHAMHLYMFCLPDVVGKDSVFDFDKKEEKVLKKAFAIKNAANKLCTAVMGRIVHGLYSQVGGFNKLPMPQELKGAAKDLKAVREDIVDTLNLFAVDWKLESKRDYIALLDAEFDFTEGVIKSSRGPILQHDEFADYLHRVVFPYSQSTGFQCLGEEYRVGALARLNLNKGALHKDTKKDAAKLLKRFPSNDIFDNIPAQAVEMLQCVDRSIDIIESFEVKGEKPVEVKLKAGTGTGVVEAPRGTLFYELTLDDKGMVKDGLLVIPTAQNQLSMQCDIGLLVQDNIDMNRYKLEHEIEKLVRAYDPCFSCATHFLKVKWKEER
jgi:coenzyme F420-reducing hydrogenase alpha subunit